MSLSTLGCENSDTEPQCLGYMLLYQNYIKELCVVNALGTSTEWPHKPTHAPPYSIFTCPETSLLTYCSSSVSKWVIECSCGSEYCGNVSEVSTYQMQVQWRLLILNYCEAKNARLPTFRNLTIENCSEAVQSGGFVGKDAIDNHCGDLDSRVPQQMWLNASFRSD